MSVGREVNYKGAQGTYCKGGGDETVLYLDYGVSYPMDLSKLMEVCTKKGDFTAYKLYLL